MYYMLWIVDGKLWSTHRCVIIIPPVGAQQRHCHYLPTIIDHWSCLSLSVPQTQFICCFIIWTGLLLPLKYMFSTIIRMSKSSLQLLQNICNAIDGLEWDHTRIVEFSYMSWIGSHILGFSCEFSYTSWMGARGHITELILAWTYGRVACDNMEEQASWCRSGHCQKDLQRQSQHQAHWARFDLSWTYQMPGLNYPSRPPSFHLSDGPVSCCAHHGLPFCLEPTEWDSSAYSGGFFALTNFLGHRFAERRTDVYVLTFTAPVDEQTGRMGETLCLAPTIFSFSQLCHQDVNLFFGQ